MRQDHAAQSGPSTVPIELDAHRLLGDGRGRQRSQDFEHLSVHAEKTDEHFRIGSEYYQPFQGLDRVYWSLVGASGVTSGEEREHVFRLAERNENIVGFILDDFFHGHVTERPTEDLDRPLEASLSPEDLRELRNRTVRGQRLPLMAVVYTGQISPRARTHLAEVDEICLWTWRPADLARLEQNLAALEQLVPGKRIFLGCYMYDFADRKPLSVEAMRRQTELGYGWLKSGRIEGMIFLATPNVDVSLRAVEWTRGWIDRFGGERIVFRR